MKLHDSAECTSALLHKHLNVWIKSRLECHLLLKSKLRMDSRENHDAFGRSQNRFRIYRRSPIILHKTALQKSFSTWTPFVESSSSQTISFDAKPFSEHSSATSITLSWEIVWWKSTERLSESENPFKLLMGNFKLLYIDTPQLFQADVSAVLFDCEHLICLLL